MSGIEAVTGKALPLPLDDVDIDVIYPALFLLHTEKRGLSRFAFHDRPAIREAYALAGSPPILIAGANLGCRSSASMRCGRSPTSVCKQSSRPHPARSSVPTAPTTA